MRLFSFFYRKKPLETKPRKIDLSLSYRVLPRNLSPAELLTEWKRAKQVSVLLKYDDMLAEMLTCGTYEAKIDTEIDSYFSQYAEDCAAAMAIEDGQGTALNEFSTFSFDHEGEILLVEVPVEQPWQIFRHLPIGGWNCCPEAGLIEIFCRRMYEQFGARPAVIGADTLELVPDRRPDANEALELAQQMYMFCPDIVEQGVGSIRALADSLTKSDIWYFWWD